MADTSCRSGGAFSADDKLESSVHSGTALSRAETMGAPSKAAVVAKYQARKASNRES